MTKQEEQYAVYEHELNVLSRSRLELRRPAASSDSIRAEYERLMDEYEKLMKWSKKIAAISDVQATMLRRRERDIKNLLDHANQGFLTFGPRLSVNPQFSKECERIFGRSVFGLSIVDLLFPSKEEDQSVFCELLRQAMRTDTSMEEARLLLTEMPENALIGEKYVTLEYRPIVDDMSQERLVLLIITDISEQAASQERIRDLSYRDQLTSLNNRQYMEPILDQPPSSESLPVSMMVIDLNGLKLANDMFGHREGDRLLARGAELLRAVFGDDQAATLARWGGDEFVVLLPRTDLEDCNLAVTRLKSECERSAIDPVKVSMAIGAATLTHGDEPLMSAFAAAEKQMYKNKLLDNRKVRVDMMNNVTTALIARGVEASGHQQRLHDQTSRFASRIGLRKDSPDMQLLESLIRMHDIGYLALPSDLLLKSESLTEEEWELVKSHSEIGYRMASSIGEWALAEAIRGMHESWDGSGYPYGLSAEQIPYASRLLAIIDAYDVMTHDQSYKRAVSPEIALGEIEAQAGRQFDPELAEAWMAFVRETDESIMNDYGHAVTKRAD
ncbi:HD domain-containing phosphohydrolase [Paenibacillus sp. HB172176]|uniref:bifunctional diguanylate cyclase/phosphohydrolase n=1 Tax=Paenibacillus sp. HB172176 TaxID=2493690 RepID=UPI00143998FA|nr:HD domain-containing phosphohydrolase [Paenibacillus sp. HB172176]